MTFNFFCCSLIRFPFNFFDKFTNSFSIYVQLMNEKAITRLMIKLLLRLLFGLAKLVIEMKFI